MRKQILAHLAEGGAGLGEVGRAGVELLAQ
jgi:hypothetical protein